MSKTIKVTMTDLMYEWFRKAAESEDKTDSAMGRKSVKTYLSRLYGSQTIKTPPKD